MNTELTVGIIAGACAIAGGILGGIASWVAAYFAPQKLEAEREKRAEARIWGPRKALIKEMLNNAAPQMGRSLKTLKRVTGTSEEDLHRLLVELGARGFTRPDGEEAWDYAVNRPLRNHKAQQDAAANP